MHNYLVNLLSQILGQQYSWRIYCLPMNGKFYISISRCERLNRKNFLFRAIFRKVFPPTYSKGMVYFLLLSNNG